jgi:CDP-diacylglycerol---glycerol-3-phosphate 3-phosphatidyltransferase
VFGIASAIGYFLKFWRKVDDSIKIRRRKELLRIERQRKRMARTQGREEPQKAGQVQ